MAIFYKEGETKKRPGVYMRYSNLVETYAGARDGICAIPIQASWGPLGQVVENSSDDLTKNYGAGTYSATYTVPAAQEMFNGGATTVYTYRMGTGGTKASLTLETGVTATAKYVGTLPIGLSIQPKLSNTAIKEVNIYADATLVETYNFAADSANEPANLVAACAGSKYIDFTLTGDGTGTIANVAEASGALARLIAIVDQAKPAHLIWQARGIADEVTLDFRVGTKLSARVSRTTLKEV